MYWSKQLPAPRRTVIDFAISDETVGLGIVWEDEEIHWSIHVWLIWIQLMVLKRI